MLVDVDFKMLKDVSLVVTQFRRICCYFGMPAVGLMLREA